jgi:hypothetical protein
MVDFLNEGQYNHEDLIGEYQSTDAYDRSTDTILDRVNSVIGRGVR